MTNDISTIGYTNVNFEVHYLCSGSWGRLYYSTNSGSTWNQFGGNLNSNTWTSLNSSGVFDNHATLRFGFHNTDGVAIDPAFSIDEIKVTGISACSNTSSNINEQACITYTSPSGKTWTTSNTYLDTINNMAGCDSVITINLTINQASTSTDILNACDSLVWIDGNTYTTHNNTATFTTTNVNGCDSVITLSLTVNTINDSVYIFDDWSLIAIDSNSSFQWLYCNNNYSTVAGATNQHQSFTETVNFSVELTNGACIDTSECLKVVGEGIYSNPIFNSVEIYPNPSNGTVLVNLKDLKNVEISITNLNGKTIYKKENINQTIYKIEIDVPVGIYIMTLKTGKAVEQYKILLK